MVPLLALGLSMLALAVLPRTARPGLLVVAAAVETAVVLQAVTGDAMITAGGAIVASIVALLVWELGSSIVMRLVPSQEVVRLRALERRARERQLAADERRRRHDARQLRRTRAADERAAA